MRNKILRFFIFLAVNFFALGLGSFLMNNGPRSDWYFSLHKAPWTPPGFVFGIAWSLIMLCFTFYMTKLTSKLSSFNTQLIGLYALQWVLNVLWNYLFFNKHFINVGFVILLFLFSVLVFFLVKYYSEMKKHSLLLLPYVFWMLIAISLNGFILVNN